MARRFLDELVPEGHRADRALRRRLAREAERRVAFALAEWRRIQERLRGSLRSRNIHWDGLDGAAAGSRTVHSLLRGVLIQPQNVRETFLAGGLFRSWLAAVEDSLSMAGAALRALRARGTPAAAQSSQAWMALMDRVVDAGQLARLAPVGKLPADFPARALRTGMSELNRQATEFVLVALPFLAPRSRRGRYTIPWTEDPEEGRPAGELWAGAGVTFTRLSLDPHLVLDLHAAEIFLSGRRAPYPAWDLAVARDLAPAVAAPVIFGARRLEVLTRNEGFAERVWRALDLLDAVWPAGGHLVRSRTRLVVPLVEPGTVSFSSARRPGVSFINIRSRPAVRLAEDLLHEATHMRLHEIECVVPLVRRRRASAAVRDPGRQEGFEAGPRFYSPWRREWRPLRGLLHAAGTFTAGAKLFEATLREGLHAATGNRPRVVLPVSRRLWLARRFLEEMEDVGVALRTLAASEARRHLTSEGRTLAETIAREHRALAPAARARERWLAGSGPGRKELARVREHAWKLRAKPVRWGWGSPAAGRKMKTIVAGP